MPRHSYKLLFFVRPNLDQKIDSTNRGVPKDLGVIADCMKEWEGKIAEELGLTDTDVAVIKTKFPHQLNLQT